MRKFLQFRFHNWYKERQSGVLIFIVPTISIYFGVKENNKRSIDVSLYFLCFEFNFWFNATTDVI